MKVRKLWTCSDGRQVRICDMHEEHLVNAIRKLERKARAFLDSLRPEDFTNPAEYEVARWIEPSDICYFGFPLYRYLIRERTRRSKERWRNRLRALARW